jgi:hypothetical protein
MTTSLPHTHIRVRDLSELVAGIPHILGFPPTDSLVLFTFRRCPDLMLSTTIRVNLPKPEHVPLVVAELTAAVARNNAVAAIAVVVGESGPEHRELVETLEMTLAEENTLLTHASWVPQVAEGEQWQCYDDPLCTGTVSDPHTSALVAATAVAGATVFPSREALTAHLAPDSVKALVRRRKLMDAYRSAVPRPYSEAGLRADLEALGHALDKVTSSRALPTLNDHELARLGIALSQEEVKDECMAIALSDESEPAERLWTMLVRALPAPERAEPAFLLAISSYLRGSGVIAALALKITMEADPEHDMAFILDYALKIGTPPGLLKNLIMKSIARSRKEDTSPPLDDDPPWDTTPAEEELTVEDRDDRDLASTEQPAQRPTVFPASPAPERAVPGDGDLGEAQSPRPSVSSASSLLERAVHGDADPDEAQCQRPMVPPVPAEPVLGEDDSGEVRSQRLAVSPVPSVPVRAVRGDADPGEVRSQWPAVSLVPSVRERPVLGEGDLGEVRSPRPIVSPASSVPECAVQGDADPDEVRSQRPAVSLVPSVPAPPVPGEGGLDEVQSPRPIVSPASSVSERAVRGDADPGEVRSRWPAVSLVPSVPVRPVLGEGDLGEVQSPRLAVSPALSVPERAVHGDADPDEAQCQRPTVSLAPSVLERPVLGDGDDAQSQRLAVSSTTSTVERGVQGDRAAGEDRSRQPAVSSASSVPERAVQGDGDPGRAQCQADRDPAPFEAAVADEGMAGPESRADLPRVAPGPLSQQAAIALGIPVEHVAVMDPLTAFLPPPTERSGPW